MSPHLNARIGYFLLAEMVAFQNILINVYTLLITLRYQSTKYVQRYNHGQGTRLSIDNCHISVCVVFPFQQ